MQPRVGEGDVSPVWRHLLPRSAVTGTTDPAPPWLRARRRFGHQNGLVMQDGALPSRDGAAARLRTLLGHRIAGGGSCRCRFL